MSYARTLRRLMLEHLRTDPRVQIEQDNRHLHPTKGWRYPSIRSAHAQLVTAEIRKGLRRWSSHAFADMLKFERIVR